jgi:M6 family metalloprotease-like protein
MRVSGCRLAALALVLSLLSAPAFAVPASPDLFELRQADGSVFVARQWGDEHRHGWRTDSGEVIVFDAAVRSWAFADADSSGILISSGRIVGKDTPPPGAIFRVRDALAQRPRAVRSAPAVTPEPPRGVPPTGTANVPVILVNFSNTSTTYTTGNFSTMLFGTGVWSMKDYYQEVSYGALTVTGGPAGVVGWYTAANTHNYYGVNDGGGNDTWPGTLVREAVVAADLAGVNFAPYDNDGDCYVDVVNVVHQGTGEEASGVATDIWSHSWDLFSANYFGHGGGTYTTNDDCAAGGKIIVNDYVIQPEIYSGGISTVGVYAHEFGHALGLPDLYDTDGTSEGAGKWSVMASGSWNQVTRGGDRPGHPDPWSKWALGWLTPANVLGAMPGEQVTAANSTADVYRLGDGTTTTGEYFLVENRQKAGFDAGLPASGLLVWHIDAAWIQSHWGANTVNNTECYPGKPGGCSGHYGVSVEQADNLWNLEKYANRGDAGDPFPGTANRRSFNATSTPNSNLWSGAASGSALANISNSGTTMTVDLSTPDPSIPSNFANIATRGKVLTGADIMIGGITVGGTSPMTFVFRGLGPSLTAYGVPGALANPIIRVYRGQTMIATNDDWGSLSPADRAVLSTEGLTPNHARDSALVLTLDPGQYTLHLLGANKGTGVGLVEVYETSLWGTPSSPPDEGGVIEGDQRVLQLQGYRKGAGIAPVKLREQVGVVTPNAAVAEKAYADPLDGLSNIATRGKVLSGADVMIAGLTITGGAYKPVVIRGVGPSLAAYGVPGALANPKLEIYSGQTKIAENDNWGTLGASDKGVLTTLSLTPAHSMESAVVLTLAPGPYTAILRGVNNGTGVGLVEVYDADKWGR